MFNSQMPRLEDLPTSKQLVRSTVIAAVSAAAILVTVILPSEYGVDPTGVGKVLGLTEMGEIKTHLAEEAAADAAADLAKADHHHEAAVPAAGSSAQQTEAPAQSAEADAKVGRTDTTQLTLAPNEGAEIKVTAPKGTRIAFKWSVDGGHVNYDTHGDAPGVSYHGYGKGRQSTGEQGDLVAAFDGAHGWFWRNRSGAPVTITLHTEGGYTEIKRVA